MSILALYRWPKCLPPPFLNLKTEALVCHSLPQSTFTAPPSPMLAPSHYRSSLPSIKIFLSISPRKTTLQHFTTWAFRLGLLLCCPLVSYQTLFLIYRIYSINHQPRITATLESRNIVPWGTCSNNVLKRRVQWYFSFRKPKVVNYWAMASRFCWHFYINSRTQWRRDLFLPDLILHYSVLLPLVCENSVGF